MTLHVNCFNVDTLELYTWDNKDTLFLQFDFEHGQHFTVFGLLFLDSGGELKVFWSTQDVKRNTFIYSSKTVNFFLAIMDTFDRNISSSAWIVTPQETLMCLRLRVYKIL